MLFRSLVALYLTKIFLALRKVLTIAIGLTVVVVILVDMVPISPFGRIWLRSFFNLLFRTFSRVVSLLLAVVTSDMVEVFLRFNIRIVLFNVVSRIKSNSLETSIVSISSLESTIMVMVMMLVVVSSIVVVPLFMSMVHFIRKVILKRRFRMTLTDTLFPLLFGFLQ